MRHAGCGAIVHGVVAYEAVAYRVIVRGALAYEASFLLNNAAA